MLFNSIPYLIFLPIVFCLYWFVFNRSLRIQNSFMLLASYFFYAWWDWRFLGLLFLSTLIDYTFGLLINNSTRYRKTYLWLSVFNNLAVLAFFKYFNFFIESAEESMRFIGLPLPSIFLNIALPVGISFYTFHGMSYVFDIYRERLKPTRNFIDYALFVSFFPLLVAGPIERAHHLLPQIQTKRVFKYKQAVQGLRLILWGFFKKVVIADTLAVAVNDIFTNYHNEPGSTLIFGAFLFSIQIYGDFSGYTDIALGSAKLFGIELLTNFKFPYFSRDIAEFWRRWHISLSSWFRDYLYFPLGGSRSGAGKAVVNTFIIFIVSGFWHGAKWTFVFWGLLHALLFIPLLVLKMNRRYTTTIVAQHAPLPSLKEFRQILTTYLLVTFAWIFFRSVSIKDAFEYIARIPHGLTQLPGHLYLSGYAAVLVIADWLQRKHERNILDISNRRLRYLVYFLLSILVILHFPYINKQEFIYFKF